MLNADKPQVVQNDRRICGNLCTDCCALIERIRSAAAPVRFYDQLNRPPAFKVNNAVSVLAEYQRAVNISRTVPVVGLCRIIAPNDAVCGQCGGFGQLNGICIRIIRGFGIQRVFIAPDMNGVAADGEIFFLRFGGRVFKHKGF